MEFFETVSKRGSYRGKFTDERIGRDVLEKIVTAGIRAPSGCNCQTTSFVIVDETALIEKIGQIMGKSFVLQAAALIVAVADTTPAYGNETFYKEDAAAAIENILLAIADLSYATVWLDGVLRVNRVAERIGSLLGVPESKRVQILLPVGRPAEPVAQKEKLPFSKRAWFNRYEGK